MKKKLAAILALLLALVLCVPALAQEYVWEGHNLSLMSMQKETTFVPVGMSDDEYCVTVFVNVDDEIWKNETLQELLADASFIKDTQGNVYIPQVTGYGSKEPFVVFYFAVPASEAIETLVFHVGEEAPAQSTNVEIGGLTLIPVDASNFMEMDDGVQVRTRVGATHHNSGAQMLAGSSLMMGIMRGTTEYAKPMAVFAYEGESDAEAAAELIGEIGKTATLVVDGQSYSVSVAWIAESFACFVFDVPELPATALSFSVEDGALVIRP